MKKEFLHVSIEKELKAKSKLVAKSNGLDLSNYVRLMLTEKVKEFEKEQRELNKKEG